jgi:hypothetical protein
VTTSREALTHLLSCVDAIYLVMGEAAPTLRNDAYVVQTFESARAMGEVALALRDYVAVVTIEPMASVVDVLRDAVAGDENGAMLLFCFVVVVGPRLLVSLRDAREHLALDEAELALTNLASETVIAEMLAVGEAARDAEPEEDETWQERARALNYALEEAGFAESLGLGA